MSLRFRNQNGEEQVVAGLGISGELIPSASYVQRGTINVTDMGTSNDKTYKDYNVTFQTPMPDADYEVTLTSNNLFSADVLPSLTKNGFSVRVKNYALTNGTSYGDINWTAFKLITNEDRALDEQAIADLQTDKADKVASATNGDIASLDANGNLVDSGVVASDVIRRVRPSSAVDCNDLTNLFTEYRVGSGDANRPTTDSIAYIIRTFRTSDTSTIYSQIAYSLSNTDIYRRNCNSSGVWSSWEKLIRSSDLTSTVTSGSTAPITSGGVYNAVNGIAQKYNVGGNTSVTTSVNVNGGSGGKTILAILSSHSSTGDASSSAILMIRCGYNDNKYAITTIASSYGIGGRDITGVLSVDNSGYIIITAPSTVGNLRASFMTNQ